MPFSLTCTCGARLEIDDKFAGQVINCPDCHKELVTAKAAPLGLRTSGWAMASLLLALVGGFTIIGPLLAMGCGWVGSRQIHKYPEQLAGKRYAQAGIILGFLFMILGAGALLSPEILGVDGLVRDIEWAGKLDYAREPPQDKEYSITRTSPSWGMYRHLNDLANFHSDDLILINAWQDAQVACMTIELNEREDPEAHLDRALQRFLSSELVHILGRFRDKTPKLNTEVRDKKKLDSPKGSNVQEMLVDLTLAGYPRTFLLRVIKMDAMFKINVVAAGSRRHRFARLEPELRKIVTSYKISP